MSGRRHCPPIKGRRYVSLRATWLLVLGLLLQPGLCRALVPPADRQPHRSSPRWLHRAPEAGPRFTIEPYLQDVRTDGVVVVWETDVPVTGMVRLEIGGRGAAFMSHPGTHHEVRLSGLRAGARYRYHVAIRGEAGPEVKSQAAEFTTAPVSGGFAFLVYGDNRDREADHAAVIRAMVPEHPDFVIQTGDMVGNAGEDILWRRYFGAAAPLLRGAPMYPALGNHEIRGDPEATHFYRYFVLPGGEDPRQKAVYYSFRYSNALFVALDGNLPNDAGQAQWLERTLRQGSLDAGIRHMFVFIHQPPYAIGSYCGSERAQRRFVPLFTRYRVRAVFGGHEHAYQHLERGGVRYFVSGGGGAPLYTSSNPCSEVDQQALRLFRPEHHYLRVRVRGEEAYLVAISKSGRVLDEVSLHQPVPPRLEGPPVVARRPPREPPVLMMGENAMALPVALATGVAVGTAGMWLVRRTVARRRRDLLPGGEPPPPLRPARRLEG